MRNLKILILLFSFGVANAQYTAIPDPNFEQELINDGVDSEGILDGRILTSDAATTQTLLLGGLGKANASKITDLTGIEAFTVLRVLRCDNNLLTNIDLSNNLNLEELQCYLNNLTELDISANTQLTLLYCNNNALTRLDVSNNINLIALRLHNNDVTTLDVTDITGLTQLFCQSNDLRLNLDLSRNSSLTSFNATSNPDLLCIQVGDPGAADAGVGVYTNWTKDATASYSEDCEALFPTTSIPDGRFEDALIALGHDDALDNRVLTSNISGLVSLDVSGESITDLTGIQDFAALQDLIVSNNDLVTLNVTQNANLQSLNCSNNSLVSLNVAGLNNLTDLNCDTNNLNAINVTQNPNLQNLNCANNVSLGSLDVSQNGNLEVLNCSNNSLTLLNVRSNLLLLELYANFNQITNIDTSYNAGLRIFQCINNNLTSLDVTANSLLEEFFCSENSLEGMLDLSQNDLLTHFDATTNSSLYCIQVLDVAAAEANMDWSKDGFAVYSENCSDIVTYVPDDAFEQHLINQGLDDQLDNYVLTVNIENVNTLDLSSEGVADMTGIEDFAALEELYCDQNAITSLDVSQNTTLFILDCGNNQITNLTLNTTLVSLICDNNDLTAIDVSQNTGLLTLVCHDNDLATLDVSSNLSLTNLDASSNLINDLNLGDNTVLSNVNVADNRLTAIDVAQNTGLTSLRVNDNLLLNNFDFNLNNHPLLTDFSAINNPNLLCVVVADAGAADAGMGQYSGWFIDASASYTEVSCVASSEEFELLAESITLYPNPAQVNVFVSVPSDVTVKGYSMYDIQGRRVLRTQSIGAAGLNVTRLQEGIYFLAVETEKYTVTKKVIVWR